MPIQSIDFSTINNVNFNGSAMTTVNFNGVQLWTNLASDFLFSILNNTTDVNVRQLAINAGWNQSDKVIATIGSGVIISGSSDATPALVIDGSWPSGIELINNGIIQGCGGKGGNGGSTDPEGGTDGTGSASQGTAGSNGGTALSASVAVIITNNGSIRGGGGGGGGGGSIFGYEPRFNNSTRGDYTLTVSGGGGGGGKSGNINSLFGLAGIQVDDVDNGDQAEVFNLPLNGEAGTITFAGNGGEGGEASEQIKNDDFVTIIGGNGGTGGDFGSSGNSGNSAIIFSGDFRSGEGFADPTIGGAGGLAISGNSNITWNTVGTRVGIIT
jgi:hypothetical protein